MTPRMLVLLALLLPLGCDTPHSRFDFIRSDTPDRYSTESATGKVDNAGNLEIHDAAYAMTMKLGGLASGTHSGVSATFLAKGNDELFTGDRSCEVTLGPHESSNGSRVEGPFNCVGLQSSRSGSLVNFTGSFSTLINDVAN